MAVYNDICYGTWIARVNRFAALVLVDDGEERVHVRNSGRLRELLIPGARVALEPAVGGNRATRYSLVAVQAGGQWVNVDSTMPNRVVLEALGDGGLPEFGSVHAIRQEVRYGQSRFDLSYECDRGRGFVEVKGVTLVEDGVALFPDAPTARGARHLRELADAARSGWEAWVLFIIQRLDAKLFRPHWLMDRVFAETLVRAEQCGVKIGAYRCRVRPDEVHLCERVPVDLSEARLPGSQ